MSSPARSSRENVGSMPWNDVRPGERALGRPVHRDLVALGDDVLHLEAQVGRRAEELRPVGAEAVGTRGLVAEDAHHAVGRPRGGDRVQILVRQRLEVGGHDGLRGALDHARDSTVPPHAQADPTSGGGARRARAPRAVAAAAPAAVAGRPALQRVGDRGRLRDRARRHRHARARLARPPRARARPGAAQAGGHPARGDHPRARRPLRPGAPDRRPRGLRGVGAPEPPALLRLRRRPRGRPPPPRRDRAPERRAEGPAAPRPLARRRPAPSRPRPRCPASTSRPTWAAGRSTRRPATRPRTSSSSSASGGC